MVERRPRRNTNAGLHRARVAGADWKTTIYLYQLPGETFACLEDAGMHLGKSAVTPLRIDAISDLPAALRLADVELRPVDSLTPFRGVWDSTLHASGIRLRNASGWELIELPRERG